MEPCTQLWPRGPTSYLLQIIPNCWARQDSPTPHSLLLSGPANLGPPHHCAHRTLTPSHIQGTRAGSVPELGAVQESWCWPGGHITRSLLERDRSLIHLLTGRDCAVPFCLCNINTDFYTSTLWLLVLSITVFDYLPLASIGSL